MEKDPTMEKQDEERKGCFLTSLEVFAHAWNALSNPLDLGNRIWLRSYFLKESILKSNPSPNSMLFPKHVYLVTIFMKAFINM